LFKLIHSIFFKGAILTGTLLFIYVQSYSTQNFDEERAFSLIEKQCSFGARTPNSKSHVAQVAWMVTELSKHKGAQVTRDTFSHLDRKRNVTLNLTNVSIVFKGKLPGRRLFCAHFDCRPWSDMDPNPAFRNMPVPGANDGASGVAVLMEACHSLSVTAPPVTIEIIFFDGEDYGMNDDQWCLGSKRFASRIKGSDYNYAVLLDMIGKKDLRVPMELNSLNRAPQLTTRIFSSAEELGLKAFVSKKGISIYDDHIPLLDKNIPAVDLIDLDYKYWHTIEDTPDKCSPESLRQVGKLVLHLMYE
jgi:hypothetical protein